MGVHYPLRLSGVEKTIAHHSTLLRVFLMGTLKNQLPVDFSSRKTKTSFAFAHIFSNLSG